MLSLRVSECLLQLIDEVRELGCRIACFGLHFLERLSDDLVEIIAVQSTAKCVIQFLITPDTNVYLQNELQDDDDDDDDDNDDGGGGGDAWENEWPTCVSCEFWMTWNDFRRLMLSYATSSFSST